MLQTERNYQKLLFLQVAQGDEKAYREIFNLYLQKLSGYVYKLTKSQSTTTELVQEIFVKLWIHRSKLMEVDNHQSYLFTMATNSTLDHLRKVAQQSKLQAKLWEQIRMDENSVEDAFIARESEELVNKAVIQLSPQKQKIFILSRREGLNHDQIADHLHLSKSTIKNHMVKTLKHIRTYLGKHSETLLLAIFLAAVI